MRPTDHRESRYSDVVFECLADADRRHVVAVLRERGPSSLDELAAAVADASGRRGSRTGRLERTLHHGHLPKLSDAGIVEYDPERDVVEPTGRTAAAADVAEAVEQCDVLHPDLSGSGPARLE